MRHLFLLVALFFTVSCSSNITRISDKTYQCKAHKLAGGCKQKMTAVCPNGHKVTRQDSTMEFLKGPQDLTYFECI